MVSIDNEDDFDLPMDLPDDRPPRPGVAAIILALITAACFGVAVYAPSRAWFTLDGSTGRKADRAGMPDVKLAVDGSGGTGFEVDGKPADAVEFGGRREVLPKLAPLSSSVAPQGGVVRGLAIGGGAFVLAGTAILLAWRAPQRPRRLLAIWVPGVGIAVAVALFVWNLAWLVKVVMLSRLLNEEAAGLRALPGLGLYIALGASIAAAVALNALSRWSLKGGWVIAFQGAGLVVAAAVALAVIQPQDAGKLWEGMKHSLRM